MRRIMPRFFRCSVIMLAFACGPAYALDGEEKKEGESWFAMEKQSEASMPNLRVPTNLDPLQVEFIVQHRFEGSLAPKDEPLKNFFGLDVGAQVRIGLEFVAWSKLMITAWHYFALQEYDIGLAYALFAPRLFMKFQLEARYLNYPLDGKVINSCFAQLSMETYPFLGRIKPVINLGYETHNYRRIGFGVGLSVRVIDWLFIQGEYYPNFYGSGWKVPGSGAMHCYTAAVMIQTVAHNFIIVVGNNTAIGTRQVMMGTGAKAVHLGFNITRVF